MSVASGAVGRPGSPDYFPSHWRSLDYFNLYRLTLALALVFVGTLFADSELFLPHAGTHFVSVAYAYLVLAALFVLGIRAHWPAFQIQLTAHILADILVITLLMATSHKLAGSMGLLLVISIASGGLVGSGRLALLYAAMASIAVLLQHSVGVLDNRLGMDGFFQVGLLCAGFFATGWLAHTLTRRALHSERLAQQQAERLALLDRINAVAVEHSPNGLMAVRGDGMIHHMSSRAQALLGLTAPPTPGITRLQDCCPELARLALNNWTTSPPTLVTPAARVRVRRVPLGRADGSQLLVLEDLREAERAAQRLKLAALGRLTANIAHEIRNPLSAISHAAQLLREDASDDAARKLAGIVENNARRLDRLVEEVLTLNRRDRLKPIRFNAEALAVLITDLHQSEEIPAEAVIVDMPQTLDFRFDPDHLRQILWNLMRNAWRHCRQQAGSLRIHVHAAGRMVQVKFADDGPGVASEDQSRLFEPFFTTDAQGTGLGLFLARELAEANQAQLEYEPGENGGCFSLSVAGED